MIYFVREPREGLVKIGYSANPWRRIEALQIGNHAQLIIEAVVDGEMADEAKLHTRFAAQRVRGEWFRWSGPIAAHVASLESKAAPVGKRDPIKTVVNRALMAEGFSSSYCAELHSGPRRWTFPLALKVWRATGHCVGPIAGATPDELRVLEKFILADEMASRRRAA